MDGRAPRYLISLSISLEFRVYCLFACQNKKPRPSGLSGAVPNDMLEPRLLFNALLFPFRSPLSNSYEMYVLRSIIPDVRLFTVME